ncbi:S46 family peptidase [Parashewanella spongiae]|uniref:S46 family peptidase n=1 Tax=Parashewanella spongiae TaxID=342950 RepID=A0A3A6UCJ4_9GAMM|nr:S46 family peptidase [Parashewanella spongiae]MCL1078093.1 S46 family peptidase [Parashewanella spongiae]RJY16463.1 S46 family peptidase [Parashewanella spongiae]
MRKALIAALALTSGFAVADEGQWQPHQLPSIAQKLTDRGIEISAKQLADLSQYPMNAVVSLGYCTASFVSPKGLVVTNHHCAYGAIQHNSNQEHNYLEDGFLAKTLAAEPSAGANERLYVTEAVTNVTDTVIANLGQDPLKRYETIAQNRKDIIKQCESDDNYRCSVRSFHNGLEYYLIKQLIIRDVRLVYAPPEAAAAFGGDVDNYEYPRHSADFTFLRAYVGKDGKPAGYSEDNVPYFPKGFVKINPNGVKAGDAVFAAGYPGRTSRYRLTSELEFAKNWQYPAQAKRYQQRINTIEGMSAANKAIKIQYASTLASTANRMKKLNGLLDGFRATDIVGMKQAKENQFKTWLSSKSKDKQAIIKQLENLITQQQQGYQQSFYFDNAQSSALLSTAQRLYRLAVEKQKPDNLREQGYQERDMKLFAARLKRLDTRYLAAVDKVLWQQDLTAYLNQDNKVAELDTWLSQDASTPLAQRVDAMYKESKLDVHEQRLKWMQASAADFKASSDPFIQLAIALFDVNMKNEQASKTLAGQLSRARPEYMASLIAYNNELGLPVYPDANGTLRVTYGSVDGYQAQDGMYKQPFTQLAGIIAKNTGVEPFNAPQKLLDVIAANDNGKHVVESVYPDTRGFMCRLFSCDAKPEAFNAVPVNFLSSVDTTGGNSGSPVFNAKGELVGLNFDSTYEAITKDWFFNTEITRAIHVDIRYILWMMDKVDHADNLLEELKIDN